MCLAASGLYIAGGVSAGAFTTFLATKLARKRSKQIASASAATVRRGSDMEAEIRQSESTNEQ
jgi:hypothetical protein